MKQNEIYATYLKNAVEATDKVFGEGYAKEHPELVSSLVQAMVMEANAKLTIETLQKSLEQLITSFTETNTRMTAEGLTAIADAIKQGGLVEGR